jgi:uncharacterized iron-regulated membrane protein
MKSGFRQSMAWLHTWAGLVVGWVLFAIFLTGTTAYFNNEITRWMQPELAGPVSSREAVENTVRHLQKIQPQALAWNIYLPDAERGGPVEVYWTPNPDAGPASPDWRDNMARLDPATGAPVKVRETLGGYFLYRFHYDLHYIPVVLARQIVGVCAFLMLIAIVSGVITHKKIFADFFMLRFGKGQRSWLDAHNAASVIALPFILMITYTGLVSLATTYVPATLKSVGLTETDYFADRFPQPEARERSGRPAPLAPLGPMMDKASHVWGGDDVYFVGVQNPNDASASVQMGGSTAASISTRGRTVAFDGVSGAPRWTQGDWDAAAKTESVMIGLHAGRYAGAGLRILYFLSGLCGVIMIGTGLMLWTSKRRLRLPDPTRPHFGFRLVETLNIGVIGGLPAGIAAYFLANRLLPLDLPHRSEAEIRALFIVWAAVLVYAGLRKPRRAWIETLWVCAALYLLLPIVNQATTDRGLIQSVARGDIVFVSFDLLMAAAGLVFTFSAWRAQRAKPPARPQKKARPG